MARLPFEQTNLVSPSQNRLSPVASPRVQPLDLQTSANYAKLESLKQLGKGIFSIGDAVFQYYANQKKEEKRIQYEQVGLALQKESLLLEEDLRSNPSKSQQEDAVRVNEFWYGKREDKGSRFEELQKNYDLPEKELKLFFEKAQVDALSVAMASRTRMDFETKLFKAGSGFDRDLQENIQSFDIQNAPEDRTEFITQMDSYFESLIKTHSEGLNSAQLLAFQESAFKAVSSIKAQRLGQFDQRSVYAARANYSRKFNAILSLNLERDEAIDQIGRLIIEYGPDGKRAFDEEEGVKQFLAAEEIYDTAFANRLIDQDPVKFLQLYNAQEPGEPSFLPSLNAIQREAFRQKAENEANNLAQKGRSESVTTVQRILDEMLNPETDLVRLKADFVNQIGLIPEEDRPRYTVAMDYYESLRQSMPNPLSTTKLLLEQALLQKNPDYYQSETGGADPAIDLKRAAFSKFRNYVNQIMELRESNPGLFWKQEHPNADPLQQSSISGNIQEQIRYLGADPRNLSQLIRVGKVKLMENSDMDNMVLSMQGLPSGVEYAQAYNKIISDSGTFAPYFLEQLGRNKQEGGLGIEPSNYFYSVIRDPAIRENLRSSELNREMNNKQFQEIMGIEKVAFNQQVQEHSSMVNFRSSYPMSNQSISAFVSSTVEMVKGYAMELKSRDRDLSVKEAIGRAVNHLIDTNYAFVEPRYAGGTGRMVRIPRAEMGNIEDEGAFEDALGVFITEVQERIEDPLIKETFTDREWAWFNDPMDQGFDLYTRVQGGLDQWVKVRVGDNDKQPLIPYSKLRVMAEDPRVAEKASISGRTVETATDLGLTGNLDETAKEIAGRKGTGVQGFSTEKAKEQLGQAAGAVKSAVTETLPGVVDAVADFFTESEAERAARIEARQKRFRAVGTRAAQKQAEREAARSGGAKPPQTKPVDTLTEQIKQVEEDILSLGDFSDLPVVQQLLDQVKRVAGNPSVITDAEGVISNNLIRIQTFIAQEKTNRQNMKDVLESLERPK